MEQYNTQRPGSGLTVFSAVALAGILAACPGAETARPPEAPTDAAPQAAQTGGSAVVVEPGSDERRLRNLRMLTFGGENAEAYFSADGRRLIFQATRSGESECDQIYTMTVEGGDTRMVSTGLGRTTCSYFFPDGERIVYSSTHEQARECPPRPDLSSGYVWALYDFDIYTARADGSELERLFRSDGYDAEATISADGSRIVFTSVRDGDIEIYSMRADGSDVSRLTDEEGYDGGPFFSADGSMIVYRAHHPSTPAELEDYRRLLAENLVRPSTLEIWVMDADGSNKRQITDNGAANFAPFFHPDGERIIFSSNMHDPAGRNFDLYLVGVDGTGLERVTTDASFDGFPMFTPDGRQLVFGSNREAPEEGSTNIFIADWVEDGGER